MSKISLILIILSIVSCSNKAGLKSHLNLYKIVNGEHRSDENKARDVYRNPIETLRFFEVRPDMKVVEVSPGGGWYTEILGPYLKDGELYLAIFSDKSKRSYAKKLNDKVKALVTNKKLYGKVNFTVMEAPEAVGPVAPANSVDRVLTFRNIHNWMKESKAKEAFQSFYKALKPGGILGVVEHRAKMNKKQDPLALSGYVREDYIIKLAESVGFKFVAKSEINANYLDKAEYSKGVWTLPPSLKSEVNREEYLAIGESDRMTVKFIKPLK